MESNWDLWLGSWHQTGSQFDRGKDRWRYVVQCGFFNLSMDPPSYPKSFFTTGRAVGAWLAMSAHLEASRCLWKRRNLRTPADPNIAYYFSPPLAEKRSDIGSERMAQLFLQALMLLGKGALFAKTIREERQTWSKFSLPKMKRLKNPHCRSIRDEKRQLLLEEEFVWKGTRCRQFSCVCV